MQRDVRVQVRDLSIIWGEDRTRILDYDPSIPINACDFPIDADSKVIKRLVTSLIRGKSEKIRLDDETLSEIVARLIPEVEAISGLPFQNIPRTYCFSKRQHQREGKRLREEQRKATGVQVPKQPEGFIYFSPFAETILIPSGCTHAALDRKVRRGQGTLWPKAYLEQQIYFALFSAHFWQLRKEWGQENVTRFFAETTPEQRGSIGDHKRSLGLYATERAIVRYDHVDWVPYTVLAKLTDVWSDTNGKLRYMGIDALAKDGYEPHHLAMTDEISSVMKTPTTVEGKHVNVKWYERHPAYAAKRVDFERRLAARTLARLSLVLNP